MKRIQVSSTFLSSIGYDLNNNTLEVEFSSGDVYQYFGVPYCIFKEVIKDNSYDECLHDCICNMYNCKKLH